MILLSVSRSLALFMFAASLAATATPSETDSASRWEPHIKQYLEYDRTNPPPMGGIVFAGSSSMGGWRTLHADFPDLPVVNRGIGGSGLADVLTFNPRLVFPLRPRTIVIYSGENDLEYGVTVDGVVASFEAVCAQIHRDAPQARIIFVSLKPSPSRVALLEAIREVNSRIAKLCAADSACKFVDVFTPMLDARGAPRPELFIDDMLHMNDAGYTLWTAILGPVLRAPQE